MRLDRAYIDGYKNLKRLEVDFDERRLTTVIIGQNGAGKSNLIEALVDVFRFVDLQLDPPRFTYQIDFRIGASGTRVRLSNLEGGSKILVDGQTMKPAEFERRKHELFPDLVFGYYSGGSRRLERLFDGHQHRYYDAIKRNDDKFKCLEAARERRLFYCRPIHGVFALLALYAFPDAHAIRLIRDKLGVQGFHSALAHFHEPWFAKGGRAEKLRQASDLWGAAGPAGTCSRRLRDCAFHPFALTGKVVDDYRDKQQSESQFAAFLRKPDDLKKFAAFYSSDQEVFEALEAVDISDFLRDLHLWVVRDNDPSGDVSFADLSDGERQLLMVLGLIRISRGQRALFLLDEPDTHLNPHWQHGYLELIRNWTGVASDANDCHIILTSHNPLTIAALEKDEVRVMFQEKNGEVSAKAPYADPKGLGFTATLTEIFGLRTSLDSATQEIVDQRNTLARLDRRSEQQEKELIQINDQLNRLGFMYEDREPLYQDFLQAWKDVRYANRPLLSPSGVSARQKAMRLLINQLLEKREAEGQS